jgi:hypothetical protein
MDSADVNAISARVDQLRREVVRLEQAYLSETNVMKRVDMLETPLGPARNALANELRKLEAARQG